MGNMAPRKSTGARILRSLIDPRTASLRSEPSNIRELMIAAQNGWVMAFDNLSTIPNWLSDALCRLATGGGYSARKLYSDTREILFDVQRPVILTSISDVAKRSDLLDRCISFEFPPIAPSRRRSEHQLWQDFEIARPRILGALLEATVGVLRNLDNVSLTATPRMADLARLGTAAEAHLGWPAGAFIEAYCGNQSSTNDIALDGCPFRGALLSLAAIRPWQGTASSLLPVLARLGGEFVNQGNWPKNPRALSEMLRRYAPNLRAVGVAVDFFKTLDRQRTRMIMIRVANSASGASAEVISVPADSRSLLPSSEAPESGRNSRLRVIMEKLASLEEKAQESGDLRTAVAAMREEFRIAMALPEQSLVSGPFDSIFGAMREQDLDEYIHERREFVGESEEVGAGRGPDGETEAPSG